MRPHYSVVHREVGDKLLGIDGGLELWRTHRWSRSNQALRPALVVLETNPKHAQHGLITPSDPHLFAHELDDGYRTAAMSAPDELLVIASLK